MTESTGTSIAPASILDPIRFHAARDPDAPAITAPGRPQALSYADLIRFLDETGLALSSLDLQTGDRIAVTGANGPELATAFLAISAVAGCAPLNPAYTASEFRFYLSDLKPRAVLAPENPPAPLVEACREAEIPLFRYRPVTDAGAGAFTIDGLPHRAASALAERGLNDEALVLHTSGTTSRPKQVPLSHANLLHSAAAISTSLGLTPQDRCLNVMPLFHVHGLLAALLASLNAGASVCCTQGFLAGRFWKWIEEEGATWYTAAPTIHQAALAEPHGRHRLRFVRSCSAPIAATVIAALEQKLSTPLIEAYGMTEASHQMASNPLPPRERRPGSVGLATGCEIRIVTAQGAPVPDGERGEVCIRGANVTAGYFGNPDANTASFVDGWFRTGDEGYLDEGYLFLTGRTKEMINRGGEKIAPREIDEALLGHPAILQALAFSVPHPHLGETVGAAVVLRPGHDQPDVRSWLAGRIASFKVPDRVVFLDEIPKGPTGKPQRIGLAAKLGVTAMTRSAGFIAPATPVQNQIASAFSEVLSLSDPPGIKDNFFTDLAGTSLSATTLLIRLEEATGVQISPERFFLRPTIEGLEAILSGTPDGGEFLVTVRSAGSLAPLLCIPGSHGNLAGFQNLARHVSADRPVFAMRMPEAEGDFVSYSVESLADRYMEEWPGRGEAILLGVCSGGAFAIELAHRIEAAGGTVPLIVLVDSYNQQALRQLSSAEMRSLRLKQLRQRVQYQWNLLRRSNLMEYARPRVEAFLEVRREESDQEEYRKLTAEGCRELPDRLKNSVYAAREAVSRYQPRPWKGQALLLRVEEPRDGGYDIDGMGWQDVFAGGIDLREVAGSHLTALSEPHVTTVARYVEEAI